MLVLDENQKKIVVFTAIKIFLKADLKDLGFISVSDTVKSRCT